MMRLVVYLSGLLIALFVVISCINTRKNAGLDSAKFVKATEGRIIGTYYGDLPCIDCDAISTVLTLRGDKAYKLDYMYVGKNPKPFSRTGTWDLDNGEINLDGLDYKYRVEPNQLRQLDLSGNEIKGDLADRYVLRFTNE